MTEQLTVVWHPNLADVRYGITQGWWGTPGRCARSALLLLVFPGTAFGYFFHIAMHGRFSPIDSAFAGAAFGVLFAGLFLAVFTSWLARYLLKIQRAKGDPHRIILNDEGLERVLSDTRIKHVWSGISRIEEDSRVFILYGSSGRPLASIEKSGIATPGELARVRTLLQSKSPGHYLNNERT